MIKPQEGFQEMALATEADIAFVGGSAGGGKTFILLMEGTRHVRNPDFGFVIFRRTTPQIKNEGALWDTSEKLYPLSGATPRESSLTWKWPSGAKGKFSHLEHDKTVEEYQGAQIPYIGFDELTHFTEYQFWYMVSRNRSDCGVRPYMRGGCNPDPKSWVAKFIDWWIDPVTGYAIPERSGVIRYFTRDGDTVVWGDTKQEVIDACPHIFQNPHLVASGVELDDLVKSFTFIAGSIYENKIFIKKDPTYLGTLLTLQPEERARLLDGNWKISLDGQALCNWAALQQIFDNYPETAAMPLRCITLDAAKFGKDFAVLMVWRGWEVVFMMVWLKSDVFDINKGIEWARQRFSVTKDNVVVDADGVGDGTVRLGGYDAFHGGHPAKRDDLSNIKLDYKNYKTQCYYRFCQKRINPGQVRFSINSQTCIIYDGTSENGTYTTKIKVGGSVRDVRDLIKDDFSTARRLETPNEGVDKIQMEPKEMQKNQLKRSPDFSDTAVMREHFELRPERKGMRREN